MCGELKCHRHNKQYVLSGRSNASFNSNLQSLSELEPRVLNLGSIYAFLILFISPCIYDNTEIILNMILFQNEIQIVEKPKSNKPDKVILNYLNGYDAIREINAINGYDALMKVTH